jgi:LysR family hydrogen peroxide-inducible transcriptional activator
VDEPRLQVVPLFREPLRLVMSSGHRLADEPRIVGSDLVGEAVLSLQEHHHFHRQVEDLCRRLGAHVLRDYEGTSLDALRHMVVMGMGIAFLPALYVRSEIHRPRELRVTTIEDEPVHRTHALAWRRSTPMRGLFADLAAEIRGIALRELSDDLQPVDPDVPPSRVPRHERGSR